jgi:hypothetical protein
VLDPSYEIEFSATAIVIAGWIFLQIEWAESHMTWFGHCIVNVTTALQALPSAGQLMLISDLRDFLDRQEQEKRKTSAQGELFSFLPKADIGAQNSNMLYVLLSGGTYSAERPSDRAWLEVERIAW